MKKTCCNRICCVCSWLCLAVGALVVLAIVILFVLHISHTKNIECWRTWLARWDVQFRSGTILCVVAFAFSLCVGHCVLEKVEGYFYGGNVRKGKPGHLGFTRQEADEELERLVWADKHPPESLKKLDTIKSVPSGLTGFVERLFFTVAVAVSPGVGIGSMVGWIGAKMLTNLNRVGTGATRMQRSRAFAGLVMGLVSMFFALCGGLMLFAGTRLIGMSFNLVKID